MQTKSNPSRSTPSYAPSVPISVYRDLAEELQSTKAQLESIQSQNQTLNQQNQQLRQEIEKVVQSALQLQQVAGIVRPADRQTSKPAAQNHQPRLNQPTIPVADTVIPDVIPVQGAISKPQSAMSESSDWKNPESSPLPSIPTLAEDIFTEQRTEQREEKKHLQASSPTNRELGGLWLGVTIVMIVLTAFGAGFLIVRPLLPSR